MARLKSNYFRARIFFAAYLRICFDGNFVLFSTWNAGKLVLGWMDFVRLMMSLLCCPCTTTTHDQSTLYLTLYQECHFWLSVVVLSKTGFRVYQMNKSIVILIMARSQIRQTRFELFSWFFSCARIVFLHILIVSNAIEFLTSIRGIEVFSGFAQVIQRGKSSFQKRKRSLLSKTATFCSELAKIRS